MTALPGSVHSHFPWLGSDKDFHTRTRHDLPHCRSAPSDTVCSQDGGKVEMTVHDDRSLLALQGSLQDLPGYSSGKVHQTD